MKRTTGISNSRYLGNGGLSMSQGELIRISYTAPGKSGEEFLESEPK